MNPSEPRRNRRRNRRRRSSKASGAESGQNPSNAPARLPAPTKAETSQMPAFPELPMSRVLVPSTGEECSEAVAEILAAGLAGFDTEAKPVFRVGQSSDGPHVVQFALTDKAFIFQLYRSECEKAAAELIESKHVLKVGFGLKNDHGQIRSRFGIALEHVIDLDQVFRQLGYRGQVGVRGAIGVLLGQGFKKSKSTTTSNWAARELTERQLLYAANDAYGALKVMEALQMAGHVDP